jgi:hypothetical protein
MNTELVAQINLELIRLAAQIASTKPGFNEDDILKIFEKLKSAVL